MSENAALGVSPLAWHWERMTRQLQSFNVIWWRAF